MEQQPVISVRGEAWREADPEIAVISVTVQARDRDQRTVLDRLAARNREVLELVRGYGEAVEKAESGPVSAYPEVKPRGQAERVARYLGQARVHVTVRDFTVLGELVAKLADTELVTVAGPWWSLRPDSPVYREARIAAAQDATRRAGEYAAAFGGRLGDLIEAADVGLLTGHTAQGSRRAVAAGAPVPMSAPAGPPSLDLEPVRQPVTAHIDARFTMLLPGSPPQ
ncbi:MAG TPA: SIMPL domain-containing protein [Trebonia sp.]|nr:SIMPL domain-containing protein [Trebonia sp.]